MSSFLSSKGVPMFSRRGTLAVVCLATAMLMLDIAVVNTALPKIASDLDAGIGGIQWVVDAYTLALAAIVLTAGSIADRFGRRRLFVIGLVAFTAASLWCGAATQHRDARHGSRSTGPRRSRPLRHVARPARRRIPGVEGAVEGARNLRRDDRRLLRRRPGRRRGDHLVPRLALGLLRERPGRDRHDRGHLPLGARVARPERPPCRLARPGGGRRRPVPAGARAPARERGRLGQPGDHRRARRAPGFCSPRSSRSSPA